MRRDDHLAAAVASERACLRSTFAQRAVREKRLRGRLCLALEHLAPVTVERERAGQVGDLHNGVAVMQAASEGRSIERGRDDRTFARELLLGRDAGYITWEESTVAGHVRRSRPILEANTWLQEIRDIRLTIAGRDRARGRIFVGGGGGERRIGRRRRS